jgi:hypothetical protein
MTQSPAELRAEFIRRRDAGEPMPAPMAPLIHGQPLPAEPTHPPAVIDRDAKPEEQLRQIMAAVGKMLDGWTLRPKDEESRAGWHYLDGPGGAAIAAGVGRWGIGPGRVEFSGEWPQSDVDGYRYGPYHGERSGYSSITVALSRSAEAIANDIERRFLPGYLAEYEKRLNDCGERDVELREQNRITHRLADLMGVEALYQCGRSDTNGKLADHLYGGGGSGLNKVEVTQAGSVGLKIDTSENTAAALLRLLKRMERAKHEEG